MNHRHRRFRPASILSLALAAGGLGGCAFTPLHEQTVSFAAPHMAATAIDVEAHNGSITIRRGGSAEVSVVATLRMVSPERLGQASVTATRDGGQALLVRADAPGGWRSREGVSFEITIPEATGVRAGTGNGRIVISGLAGPADLETSNGSVEVDGHDGPVKARTSNGAIRGSKIAGSLDLSTSNGSVTVALTGENQGPAQVRTSNGSVTVEVGPAFVGGLEVSTSNGSIEVPGEGRADGTYRLISRGRGRAQVQFGEGGQASRIQTSNGSVRVRVAGNS